MTHHEYQLKPDTNEATAVAFTAGIASETFRYAKQTLRQVPTLVLKKTRFNGLGDFMIADNDKIEHFRFSADRDLRFLPRFITIDWQPLDRAEYQKTERLYAKQMIELGEQQLHGASPMRAWDDIVTAWDKYWSDADSVTLNAKPHKLFHESNQFSDHIKRSASRATLAICALHDVQIAAGIVDRIADEYDIKSDHMRPSDDLRGALDAYWGSVLSDSIDVKMALE